MRIRTKLMLFLIPVLILPTVFFTLLLLNTSQKEIQGLQEVLMTSQLKALVQNMQQEDQKLQRLGLKTTDFFKENLMDRFLDDLKNHSEREGTLFILNQQGRVLFLSGSPGVQELPPGDTLWILLESRLTGGPLTLKTALAPNPEENQMVFFSVFEPWNWIVGFMLGEGQALAPIKESLVIFLIFLMVYLVFSLGSLVVVVRHVSRPLVRLTEVTKEFGNGDFSLRAPLRGRGETAELSLAFNQMAQRIQDLNQSLEQQVEVRTQELRHSLELLKQTQDQLIQSEKMADLGALVAGVAHEINTPLGIAVTSGSHLEALVRDLEQKFRTQTLTQSGLAGYLDKSKEAIGIFLMNLSRAAELIQNFKQVAVDQSHESRRSLNFKGHMEEILLSLAPKLKRTKIQVDLTGPEDLTLVTFPGVWWQITTNLVVNSLLHGFEGRSEGKITITYSQEDTQLLWKFHDDGVGIPPQALDKIFDPFYTTKRNRGGTGLGLHIVYNLVTQKLQGAIRCTSEVNFGTTFIVTCPLEESP